MPRCNSKEDADLLAELEKQTKAKDRHQPSGRKRRNRIMREWLANKHVFREMQEFDREVRERFRQGQELDPMLMQLMGAPDPEIERVMRQYGYEPKPWQPNPLEYRTAEELKLGAEEIGRIVGTAARVARKDREHHEICSLYLKNHEQFAGLSEEKRRPRAIKALLKAKPEFKRSRVYEVVRHLHTQSLDRI